MLGATLYLQDDFRRDKEVATWYNYRVKQESFLSKKYLIKFEAKVYTDATLTLELVVHEPKFLQFNTIPE